MYWNTVTAGPWTAFMFCHPPMAAASKQEMHHIVRLIEIRLKYSNACVIHMLYITYEHHIRRHACFAIVEESQILEGRRERERARTRVHTQKECR